MRSTPLFLFLAAALLVASSLPAQGTPNDVYITFHDAEALNHWAFQNTDPALGQPRFEDGGAAIPFGPDTYMIREVNLPADQFNRLEVRMRNRPGADLPYTSALFHWSDQPVLNPDNILEVPVASNERTHAVFDLDQCLTWTGNARYIWFIPMRRDGSNVTGESLLVYMRFYSEPPGSLTPEWTFDNPSSLHHWDILAPDETHGRVDWPRNDLRFEDGGIRVSGEWVSAVQFQYTSPTSLAASSIKYIEVELRFVPGRRVLHEEGTWMRVFWGPGEDQFPRERMLRTEIRPTVDWQTLRLDLQSHPDWRGAVRQLLLIPINQEGDLWVRRVNLVGPGGLGRRGEAGSIIEWLNMEEASRAIESQDYKPLLVYIDDPAVAMSMRVEQRLSGDVVFLRRARDFHCVRLPVSNPVAQGSFGPVRRVPTMVIMTWDAGAGRWVERERMTGRQIVTEAAYALERWQ